MGLLTHIAGTMILYAVLAALDVLPLKFLFGLAPSLDTFLATISLIIPGTLIIVNVILCWFIVYPLGWIAGLFRGTYKNRQPTSSQVVRQ